MPPKIVCAARGSGSVNEGFQQLDDALVQFMLVKFPVGSGTFKRNKFVYVHHVGPACGPVKRGKWNAQLDKALALFNTSAGLTATDGKCELDFDTLVTKLRNTFVADDGTFDLGKLREEYNRRLVEEEAKMAKDANKSAIADPRSPGEPGSPLRPRKLATELGASLEAVQKALNEDFGPFNWVTVAPAAKPGQTLEMVQAGSNGLFELLATLPMDKALFGVLRMAFGTGRFRRTKRIFFQWAGDGVGPVARAKVATLRDAVKGQLIPCTAEIVLQGAADATVDAVLAKVEKVFVVDYLDIPETQRQQAAKPVSAEEYIKALEEEQRANSSFYEEPEEFTPQPDPGPRRFDVDETIKLVHQDEGGLTWAIFQVEE